MRRRREGKVRVQKEGTGFSFPYEGLIDLQEGIALKTAPHLSVEVLEPSHFDKMKVGPALFSELGDYSELGDCLGQ